MNSASTKASQASWERQLLLHTVHQLATIPKFNTDTATSDPRLVRNFYELAIRLTDELPIKPENFAYYRDNYVPYSFRDVITNKAQLIDYLDWEMKKPSRNDSRYQMGFRSVYFILNQNIDRIAAAYIIMIHKKLAPFYNIYRYPALLIPGCELGDLTD